MNRHVSDHCTFLQHICPNFEGRVSVCRCYFNTLSLVLQPLFDRKPATMEHSGAIEAKTCQNRLPMQAIPGFLAILAHLHDQISLIQC